MRRIVLFVPDVLIASAASASAQLLRAAATGSEAHKMTASHMTGASGIRPLVSAIGLALLMTMSGASGQGLENRSPITGMQWRDDALFKRLATDLDAVRAIDNHTHLRQRDSFNPGLDRQLPLLQRSTNPQLPSIIKSRFGVPFTPADAKQANDAIATVRDRMIASLTEQGYWRDHLDYTHTEIALINTERRDRTDGRRLRWVPFASMFLYPLPAAHLMERSPAHQQTLPQAQKDLQSYFAQAGVGAPPGDLLDYVGFVDETLSRWQKDGAVAVKFSEAYFRTLRIADVPESRAAALYARGLREALVRDDYIALQDFLWRHILLKAGELTLPVHIHSSMGVPPFLRTQESDVRNLEDVLADPRFFKTPVVLIHGGGPWHDIAAYLALKPNVWIDISSMAFVYPTPELARILRTHLTFAPEKVLFGTDAGGSLGVPGGDVHHILLSRATRDALYLALADLVRDGLVTEPQALEMGRGVLRDNARRLYGWK